mmetsp:Transcript_15873/g.31310  ORF Transcript_15873/g.31310 Transcript_15873/m.31310 type:complete len:212 (+) Transcript_15873:144-779(+)
MHRSVSRLVGHLVHAVKIAPRMYSVSCMERELRSSTLDGRQDTSFSSPRSRPSSACCSSLSAQRLRTAETEHSIISDPVDPCPPSSTDRSTSMALASLAAFWFTAQFAHALARAAPACSLILGSPSRMRRRRAWMPPHRCSSSLFRWQSTHALRSAPAAWCRAPGAAAPRRATSPGMAMRTCSWIAGLLAHAFQMAPAASSCPVSVPASTC